MKIGVVGKGGVGKTTVAALLARELVRRGDRVIAIDTDSNPNLGLSLGLSLEEVEAIPVLPRSVIVGSGGASGVEALLAAYARSTPSGVTLLSAIKVAEAGAGCTCAGHATVRSLLAEALEAHADTTLVDMEAGIEHLSRSGGTLAYADVLVMVVEPSRKSVLTAARTAALAAELGIPRVAVVGNKAREAADEAFLADATTEQRLELLGILPWERGVADADREGRAVTERAPATLEAGIRQIAEQLGGITAGV